MSFVSSTEWRHWPAHRSSVEEEENHQVVGGLRSGCERQKQGKTATQKIVRCMKNIPLLQVAECFAR